MFRRNQQFYHMWLPQTKKKAVNRLSMAFNSVVGVLKRRQGSIRHNKKKLSKWPTCSQDLASTDFDKRLKPKLLILNLNCL